MRLTNARIIIIIIIISLERQETHTKLNLREHTTYHTQSQIISDLQAKLAFFFCLNLNVCNHLRARLCVNFTSKSLSKLNMQIPTSMAEFGK